MAIFIRLIIFLMQMNLNVKKWYLKGAYSLAVVTYKARSTGVPTYLASLVDNYVPTRTLRSADQFLLCSPIVKLVCSRKAFSVNAPLVFNALPYNCRSARTLSSFKKLLKTHLFSYAYGPFQSSPSRASDLFVTYGASTNFCIVLYCFIFSKTVTVVLNTSITKKANSKHHQLNVDEMRRLDIDDPAVNEIKLTSLLPGCLYRIAVTARTRSGAGPACHVDAMTHTFAVREFLMLLSLLAPHGL